MVLGSGWSLKERECRGKFDQNTLCACLKLSNVKYKHIFQRIACHFYLIFLIRPKSVKVPERAACSETNILRHRHNIWHYF